MKDREFDEASHKHSRECEDKKHLNETPPQADAEPDDGDDDGDHPVGPPKH